MSSPFDYITLSHKRTYLTDEKGRERRFDDFPADVETALHSEGFTRLAPEILEIYQIYEHQLQPRWSALLKRMLDFTHDAFTSANDSKYLTRYVRADPLTESYALILHARDTEGAETYAAVWQESDGLPTVLVSRENIDIVLHLMEVDIPRK